MKSIALLLSLLFATNALAATRIKDLTTILGTGTSNNVLLQANVGTANNPTIRFNPTTSKWEKSDNGTSFQSLGSGDTAGIELMSDPSFESGISEITGTSATATSENTILRAGPNNLKSAVISYSGSTGKACVTKNTSSQFTGGSGWVQCDIRSTVSGTTDSVFRSYVDGVLQQSQAVDTRGVWQTFQIPITFGSTSAGFCIEHTSSDTSNHYIDKCSISAGDPTKSVNQQQYIGSVTITGCSFSTTGGSFANATSSGCSYSVTGSVLAPSTSNALGFRIPVWPGTYVVKPNIILEATGTSGVSCGVRLYDNTAAAAVGPSLIPNSTVSGAFPSSMFLPDTTFTSTSSSSAKEFLYQWYRASGTQTCSIQSGQKFDVFYTPPADKIYTQPNNQDSDWVSCGLTTSDFVGFGTVSSIQDQCKKDGPDLLMRVKFTAGTTTATEARVGLKFQGTTLTSQSSTYIPSIQHVGTWIPNDTGTASTFVTLIEPSVTYVTVGSRTGTASPLSKLNGNAFTSSVVINFLARVPIATWTKSQLTGTFREVMTSVGRSRPKKCWAYFGGTGSLSSKTSCGVATCTVYAESGGSCGAVSVTRSAAGVYACAWGNGTWANTVAADMGGALINFTRVGDLSGATTSSGSATVTLLGETNTGTDTDSYGSCWIEAQAP